MDGGIETLPQEQFVPNQDGTFWLPNPFYHDQEKAPGISRSLIVELLEQTPAHARSLMGGAWGKAATRAMTGGSLFDKALLEPDLFIEGESHWIIPEGMNLTTVDGRAWKKDHPGSKEWRDGDPGLPYLPAQSLAADVVSAEDCKGMIESVMRHKNARFIIENAVKQESAFCRDPRTGLMRKVRPDARVFDRHSRIVLADVKSTFRGGATVGAWMNHCTRMWYDIQDSYYSKVYEDLYERPMFCFIVVERKPPYACRIFDLDPHDKEEARIEHEAALDEFRKCQETGIWPAFDEGITTIRLPKWKRSLRTPGVE